ncbi:DUF3592 domain-containing protein [Streptomyces chitinivorans]|uniref:DUF3592 domain-containing protein n=1 Tax=Streptomyces chitinivorans TaxID=1257027 RepID=A0ABW7HN72_9ACTN|nr:DUF3592 domain-containing protein [Streptomyces chitinivorans]MDH2411125.1 hypothetical protein [Streptomyces chitinivorans]
MPGPESTFFRILATLAVPIGITSLFFIPRQLRDFRIMRRGVATEAVCLERVRQGGGSVTSINCTYRMPDGRECEALVHPPSPTPRVGQKFVVIYDSAKPLKVDSSYYFGSIDAKFGCIVQSVFGAMLTAVLVMLVFS